MKAKSRFDNKKLQGHRTTQCDAPAIFIENIFRLYVSAYDSALGVAHKQNDFVTLLRCGKLGLDALNGIRHVKTREIKIAVYLLNFTNLLVGEVTTTKSYRINSGIGYGFACTPYLRRNVLIYERTALNHNMRAYVTELMNKCSTTDHGKIVDHHFAGKLGGV